jgi:UDP-glucose-4-epimerase GalE
VTGGAGYIGSHTVRALRASGASVVVLDDLSRGRPEAVGDAALVVGDIRDEALVRQVVRDHHPSAIVHLAARKSVEESVGDPGVYFSVNVAGTLNLLEAAISERVGAFVFSSTCAVYGEPSRLPVDESAPVAPGNPYGESKAMAERMLAAFERAYGLPWLTLRYFNAAGASPAGDLGENWADATNLVPLVMRVAAGVSPALDVFGTDYPTADGTAIRDYVHVDDLAEAHVAAVEHLLAGGRPAVLNLGTGRGTSVAEVVESARRVTGAAIPTRDCGRRPGDVAAIWADPTQANALLAWSARRDLDEIVRTAWRWHSHHAAPIPGVQIA